MDFLLGHLEEVKDRNDVYPEEHFKINVELGWAKLNEYHTLLNDTFTYITALALCPAFRWTWIEKHWADTPKWIALAKTSVNQLWQKPHNPAELASQTELVGNRIIRHRDSLPTSLNEALNQLTKGA